MAIRMMIKSLMIDINDAQSSMMAINNAIEQVLDILTVLYKHPYN